MINEYQLEACNFGLIETQALRPNTPKMPNMKPAIRAMAKIKLLDGATLWGDENMGAAKKVSRV
jgi:hypothetical protein